MKCAKVMEPTTVSSGKKKQEIVVADGTGMDLQQCQVERKSRRLWWQMELVWRDVHIDTLVEGRCYLLKNFVIREYASRKFLSMAKEGSAVIPIGDIGATVEDDNLAEDGSEELSNAQIVGVLHLDRYKSCVRCKARVEPSNAAFGRCSRQECAMLQRFNVCPENLSAGLLFMSDSNDVSLYAYGQTVRDLACDGDEDVTVTEEMLLQVPILATVKYNKQNVITGIER